MRKMFALMLALCLICGGAAMADGQTITETGSKTVDTTVSMKIDAGYTVTIPPTVEIDPNTREGHGVVTVAAKPIMSEGKSGLYVKVTPQKQGGSATYLNRYVNGSISSTIYYRMYKNGDRTNAIWQDNSIILSVNGGTANESSVTLDFVIPESETFKYAGTYQTTLTFTVSEW